MNGYILKKINIKLVGFFGLLLQGFSLLFYTINIEANIYTISIYGFILGLFSGFYWSSRNFMEYQTTRDKNRDYYYGFYLSGATLISIIFNSFYGNFLGHSDLWNLSKNTLYVISSVFGFCIILISGYILLTGVFRNPIIKDITLAKATESWKKVRFIYLLTGIRESNSFLLPALLLLYTLKTEDFLGEANSLASIVVAVVIYFIGTKISMKYRKTVVTAGILILVANSFLLLFSISDYYAFLYNTVESTGNILIYLSLIPIFQKQLQIHTSNSDSEYKFIFDGELFLNFGRIVGTIFIFSIFSFFGDFWGTRLTPLFFILPHLLFLRNIYLLKN